MRLTITLETLSSRENCSDLYEHLTEALGPDWRYDQEIDLLDLLDLCGADDVLWVLHMAREPERDSVGRLIAADCAELALPVYKKHAYLPGSDNSVENAIRVARQYVAGEVPFVDLLAAKHSASDASHAAYMHSEAAGAAATAAEHAVGYPNGAAARAAASAERAIVSAFGEAARAAALEQITGIVRRHLS